jgi:hypothetical protein
MFNCKRCVILAKLLMIASLIPCGLWGAGNGTVHQPTVTPVPVIRPTAAAVSQAGSRHPQQPEKSTFSFPTMHYYGSSARFVGLAGPRGYAPQPAAWACSLFAALGDGDKFYGRNFDCGQPRCSVYPPRTATPRSRWWTWPIWGSATKSLS